MLWLIIFLLILLVVGAGAAMDFLWISLLVALVLLLFGFFGGRSRSY